VAVAGVLRRSPARSLACGIDVNDGQIPGALVCSNSPRWCERCAHTPSATQPARVSPRAGYTAGRLAPRPLVDLHLRRLREGIRPLLSRNASVGIETTEAGSLPGRRVGTTRERCAPGSILETPGYPAPVTRLSRSRARPWTWPGVPVWNPPADSDSTQSPSLAGEVDLVSLEVRGIIGRQPDLRLLRGEVDVNDGAESRRIVAAGSPRERDADRRRSTSAHRTRAQRRFHTRAAESRRHRRGGPSQ
jgi:hypothetical protein